VTRLLPGLVMTAFWVGILIFGSPKLFWLVVAIMASYGLYEYFKMVFQEKAGERVFYAAAIAVLPVLASVTNESELFLAAILLSLLGTIGYSLKFYNQIENPLQFLSLSSFGAFYITFCLAHLVFIRFLPQGVAWLLVLTAVTAGSDTGAYYLGKSFGRRKLCPHISPGKTLEGAIGGITVGTLAAVIVGLVLLPEMNPLFVTVMAFTLSLVSIMGDLVESIIKRSAGVKDSGTLLVGHGGVLDRIDSMLISAPLLYYLINIEG